MSLSAPAAAPLALPALAAAVLAVDPVGLGGAVVRGDSYASLAAWAAAMLALLPAGTAVRRVPPGTAEERLCGGLDLAATLATGRPVAERGIVAAADGGVVVIPSAERLDAALAGRLVAVLDEGECRVERDGLSLRAPARIALLALDESAAGEAGLPAALLDRLALHVDLTRPTSDGDDIELPSAEEVAAARLRLPSIVVDPEIVHAACAAAVTLGIDSLRAPLFAIRAARVLAALDGESTVMPHHLAAAASLVLAPRATIAPVLEDEEQTTEEDASKPERGEDAESTDDGRRREELDEVVLRAVQAALPAGVLERMGSGRGGREPGKSGQATRVPTHGRRIGTRPGDPRRGRRLDVLATVRGAAPWQRIRGRDPAAGDRLAIRSGDFRVRFLERRAGTVVVFVVDASGSSALHRLGEAKGAVELLLAESYARRDRVALVSFRRTAAEVVLPPTRSPARARRLLAGLPGGGGTPLAAAVDAALTVADTARRGGSAPLLVFLTDARANVARDGTGGRERAEADALAAARAVRAAGIPALVVDTGPRPGGFAARFAAEMGARHLPLPPSGARGTATAVRGAVSTLAPART